MGEVKKRSAAKVAGIVAAVIVVLLVVVYGAGTLFFASHLLPNTSFGSKDVSFQERDQVVEEASQRASDYELVVKGEDFELAVPAESLALSFDREAFAQALGSSQNALVWPAALFCGHDLAKKANISFDQEATKAFLAGPVSAFNKDREPSVDACICYDEEKGACAVKPEVQGSRISQEALMAKVAGSVSALSDCVVSVDELEKPSLLASDSRFPAAVDEANELVKGDIELTFGGKTSAGTISKEQIASWLALDADFHPSFDQSAVRGWAEQFAKGLNTVGSKRTWTRADGKVCTVEGGSFGWVVDTDGFVDDVCDRLAKGDCSSIDLSCSQQGDVFTGAGERDWGAYVDVDISQQHVRYYDANDKLLYETDCVTGNAGAHSTPTGVYKLNWKSSPQMLVGRNADGSISYETKVNYWMAFVKSSVGLHDATWRSKFGGSIYKGNGSHGCVNLPVPAAKYFYSHLEPGICVITHY